MNDFHVNDEHFDATYVERCFAEFAKLSHLREVTGRRLCVRLDDTARWIALCLYARARGASLVPVHPSTPRRAAEQLARRTGSHGLLFGDVENWQQVVDRGPDDEPVVVQFTSGSTGEPKTIERSWSSIERELDSYCDALSFAAGWSPIVACPTTHAYGLLCGVLSAFHRGDSPVIVTNVNPKYVIRHAARDRTLLYASPTMLAVIVRLLRSGQRLNAVMTSGAPLRQTTLNELRQVTDQVLQQYGCSELGCISVCSDVRSASDIGRPLAHLTLTAGSSAEAPDEIIVREDDRIVHTRDLGYLDARGLHFVSRIDDTINVAGVNVYPHDVEEVIASFSRIGNCVAYRRTDTHAGERVCVHFTAEAHVEVDELRHFCSERLSPFQMPLELRQVETIPTLPNGKVDRRSLTTPAGVQSPELAAPGTASAIAASPASTPAGPASGDQPISPAPTAPFTPAPIKKQQGLVS